MLIRETCPRCGPPKYKRSGHIHNEKQNHQCKDCGRQFVACFEPYLLSDDTPALIERFLLRATSISLGWHMKWPTKLKSYSVEADFSLKFDRDGFVHGWLSNNGRINGRTEFEERYAILKSRIAGDIREYMRGHDIGELVAHLIVKAVG